MALLCVLLFDVSCGRTGAAAATTRLDRQEIAVQAIAQAENLPYFACKLTPVSESLGFFMLFGGALATKLILAVAWRPAFSQLNRWPLLSAAVWATEQHRVCTQRVRHRLFAIPSRDATAGDDEALPIAAH